MSIARRKLPVVPKGVDVNKLNTNLKLYSDQVIALLKQQYQENGRYRDYINVNGELEPLPYPVFVFNGRYIAAYPGKEFKLGEEGHAVKLAQDLDSAEWVIEKVLNVLPEGEGDSEFEITALDVDWEREMLRERNMAVMANEEAMYLSRPFTQSQGWSSADESDESPSHPVVQTWSGADDSAEEGISEEGVVELNQVTSEGIIEYNQGASADEYSRHEGFDSSNSWLEGSDQVSHEDRSGKHYLFMQRATGANLHEWAERELPLIVRMEMTQTLASVLMSWHDGGFIHRDVKGRNAVYDMIRNSLNMIDVGMSIHANEAGDDLYPDWGTPGFMAPEIIGENADYSEKSDLYAFGITIGVLWGFIEIKEIGSGDKVKYQAELAAKSTLQLPAPLHAEVRALVVALTHDDPEERESLRDILHSLNRLQGELSAEHRTIRVAVVDAGEYYDKMGDDYFNKHYLEDLASYQMVALLDVDGAMPESDLLLVKQDLEAADLIVDTSLFEAGLSDMRKHCKTLNQELPASGRIYRYTMECPRPEATLSDSANLLNELEEGSLPQEDTVAQAIQHAYRQPVALRQRRNPVGVLEAAAHRQDDVRLQMHDMPDAPTQRERRQARYEQADPHNWGDWAAWFFGNMAEDSCEIFNAVVDNTLQGLRGFSLFSNCMPCVDPLSPSVTRRLRDEEREDPYAGTEMTTLNP